MKALVVEDNLVDASKCVASLKKLGASEIDVVGTVAAALLRLDDVLAGTLVRPDLIVLDLGFSHESGFEVLRRWKSDPKLREIPVIVWTQMGETEQELSKYFGVHSVVPKWAGARELEAAVTSAHGSGA